MDSVLYYKLLNKHVKKIVKTKNLMILHDRSKVHSSKMTQAYLKKENLNSHLLPRKSPDLNPIENCFGFKEKTWEGANQITQGGEEESQVAAEEDGGGVPLYCCAPVRTTGWMLSRMQMEITPNTDFQFEIYIQSSKVVVKTLRKYMMRGIIEIMKPNWTEVIKLFR